jgi:hypothetical protein
MHLDSINSEFCLMLVGDQSLIFARPYPPRLRS